MKTKLTKKQFIQEFETKMVQTFGRSVDESHITEKYVVLGNIVREYASVHWKDSKETVAAKGEKQMYYFSMEFLMGRLLTNNLMNLQIYDVVKEGLNDLGIDINQIEEMESDAGLGNGGLGRLAACFLDSLASSNYVGHGNCIRYEYGFFKQLIDEKHEQRAVPDLWLKLGNVWEVRKPKHTVQVHFGGHVNQYMNENGKIKVDIVDSQIINAVPYDMPIVGYDTNLTNTLRLWKAEPAEESFKGDYDQYIEDVNAICNSLYPDDSTEEGKKLRVKQQYFFVCAGIHSMIRSHLRVYPSLDNLAEKVAVQLNDTHPVLAIPELMRILMDDYEYEWDQAWEITRNTMAYTNHTVLAEALEKWPIDYIRTLLPRIYMIIEEIQNRFMYRLSHKYNRPDIAQRVSIIKEGQVHMANLAIVGSHKVNGVAKLHSQILVNDVFKDFNSIMPYKFTNKTNGITHRRWLLYSNPQLTSLIESKIGDSFKKNPQDLRKLLPFVDDPKLQDDFLNVKLERKKILADYIRKNCGVEVDINSIFDVQAKRLHAYKRQLLNVMHIIYVYQRMKEDPNFRIYPRTYIFAAKAAPAYVFAKKVIKLINCIAEKVNNDPEISPFLKVVFIPNYGVSIAEILMNAADVSEQISTAGKEASGTGNMKFMMNGAITLGTLDGANVEIVDHVGYENAQIFGLRAEEVATIKSNNMNNAWGYYNNNPALRKVIDSFTNGTWSNNSNDFKEIYDELMFKNDEYLLCADFDAFCEAQKNSRARYENRRGWARLCLVNIAESGYFSSDRTIEEYATEIWGLNKVDVE